MSDQCAVVSVLIAARGMIEEPENWARGSDVRINGEMPTCAGIAIDLVDKRLGGLHSAAWDAACDAYRLAACTRDIVRFNDTHTHHEVIAAFDRAIEHERAKVGVS